MVDASGHRFSALPARVARPADEPLEEITPQMNTPAK